MITIPQEDTDKANLILGAMRTNWSHGDEADFLCEHVDRLERALEQQKQRGDRFHAKLKKLGGIQQNFQTSGNLTPDERKQQYDILEPYFPVR